MKLHVVTIGKPKLAHAKSGWEEYTTRLGRYHDVRVSHLADKFASDSERILSEAGATYKVALVVEGKQLSSHALAEFLNHRALEGREVCFIIGGPDGLPKEVIDAANYKWSLSELTFPHDLAMVILLEAIYRASTINIGYPYHH